MPRQARLDAPGTVHHIMLLGLAGEQIVADGVDRAMFLARLGAVAGATGTTLYAWALLP
jgi:putative transposase